MHWVVSKRIADRGPISSVVTEEEGELEIEFQNELLIARINGEVTVTTPDLICIVTEEEGEPVTTEVLRYGTRVAVIAVPAPAQLKSEVALEVVGPGAFGYDVKNFVRCRAG